LAIAQRSEYHASSERKAAASYPQATGDYVILVHTILTYQQDIAAENNDEDGTDMFRYLLSIGCDPNISFEKVELNRTMKYWLERAKNSPMLPPTPTFSGFLKKLDLTLLPRLEFSVVGQRLATNVRRFEISVNLL
jgi:hypothetical protein